MVGFDVLFSALTIGLLGAGHCIGMCGGISSALAFALPESAAKRKITLLLFYNAGRIASYAFIGLLAGGIGQLLQEQFGLSGGVPILRSFAGIMLILMGLYVSGWWKVLIHLERLGGLLWRYLQPLSGKLLPVKSLGAAFVLGSLWGWLPCGLIYSALAYALSFAEPVASASVMLAFGLGTLPAVFMTGVLGEKVKEVLQKRGLRVVMAVFLIAFGVWTITVPMMHASHDGHHTSHSQHLEKPVYTEDEKEHEHSHHHH